MNETIRLLEAHHSSRSYKTDPIPEEILEAIIESAHRAPTSTNSHEISLVVAGTGIHRGHRRPLQDWPGRKEGRCRAGIPTQP